MSYDSYHIPANFTDAGRVLGLFEIRNLIEAALLALPTLYLCLSRLPLAISQRITVSLVITVPLAGIALIGVNDDSLTRWLKSWWLWHRHRRIMFHRGEVKRK